MRKKVKTLTKKSRVTREDRLRLNLIGKTVTHECAGQGVVVGYSSITGEPIAYFYDWGTEEVVCFSHREIISVE